MQTQLLLILLTTFLKSCFGDYKFEVLLETYANPTHKLADGTCCKYPYFHYKCGVCDNLFTFCVHPYEYHLTKTSQSCPKSGANYTTSVITDDSISFREAQILNFVTNLSNPLVFYGKVWPGQVQLYIQVYNWDVFKNLPINNILQIWSLPVRNSYSQSRKFRSKKGHVTLTARARVMCTDGYYGPYCSTFCGVEGCSPVRATCPKEKECVCLPGYSGSSCENTDKSTTYTNASITSPDVDNSGRTLNDALSGELVGDENKTGGGGIAETSSGTDGGGSSGTGAIVGGVIGGLLSLMLLSTVIIVCLWFGRKKVAERKAFKESQDQEYQATTESPRLISTSYSGTYRMIDNNLYTQVPTEDRGRWSGSEDVTDLTISEAATASSDPHTDNRRIDTSSPMYVNRTTSQYSLVQRRDSDVSSCHSEEEVGEGEGGGGGKGQSVSKPIVSQYSVITRENMDYASEASDSEDSRSHSDAELVEGDEQEGGKNSSDLNPRRSDRERSAIKLYENIPYS